jgi:hypothetical protein
VVECLSSMCQVSSVGARTHLILKKNHDVKLCGKKVDV